MCSTNRILTHISHQSISPYINKDSFILILGSFPSVKTREVGFYYGHPQNRFWKVLSRIYEEPLPISIEEKKSFLKKHHLALYDVIYECDIIGSSDSSIKNVEPIDLSSVIEEYPNIHRIILNGGLAKNMFEKYLYESISNLNIEICYLPSTSPANARMSVENLVGQYREYIRVKK